MKRLRMVLNINKDGVEEYRVQVRIMLIWFTKYKSFDKTEANNEYRKIARNLGILG